MKINNPNPPPKPLFFQRKIKAHASKTKKDFYYWHLLNPITNFTPDEITQETIGLFKLFAKYMPEHAISAIHPSNHRFFYQPTFLFNGFTSNHEMRELLSYLITHKKIDLNDFKKSPNDFFIQPDDVELFQQFPSQILHQELKDDFENHQALPNPSKTTTEKPLKKMRI